MKQFEIPQKPVANACQLRVLEGKPVESECQKGLPLRLEEERRRISLRNGLQSAARGFELDAKEPVEMEFLESEPFFEIFAAGGVEFDEHLAFLHVHKNAAGRDLSGAVKALDESFSALAREASKRVLRDVAGHQISCKAKSSDAKARPSDTLARGELQMAEPRRAHPYHLYDAIQAQPTLIEQVLSRRKAVTRAADAIADKERIMFVGIGTSLHVALIAEDWAKQLTGGRLLARAEQSFELVHYPIAFSSADAVIVITHTGTTTHSIEALRLARAEGALTVAVAGEASGDGARGADFHIETCGQEASFAYTKSYTTALAVVALIILRVAERRKLLADADAAHELQRVPNLMRAALALEPQVRELARRAAALSRIVIFGSGTGWATAREAALKIKESCYIAAEGFETEEVLHGPFSELDSRAAIAGLLTGNRGDERARQILRAAGELKMLRAAVSTTSASHDISPEHVLVVPETPEWLAAFVHLVPLQLLTYFIALERGLNPDTGRQDQAAHAAAKKHYQY
jgi:glutamine---fructose-6-phosphate transaminase (isomerizing)